MIAVLAMSWLWVCHAADPAPVGEPVTHTADHAHAESPHVDPPPAPLDDVVAETFEAVIQAMRADLHHIQTGLAGDKTHVQARIDRVTRMAGTAHLMVGKDERVGVFAAGTLVKNYCTVLGQAVDANKPEEATAMVMNLQDAVNDLDRARSSAPPTPRQSPTSNGGHSH